MLKSALLFYLKLQNDLEGHGYEVRPYDPCMANKMINGEQMTTTWHVDELMVSHKYVDHNISNMFHGNLKIERVKKHEYLGMDLDYS